MLVVFSCGYLFTRIHCSSQDDACGPLVHTLSDLRVALANNPVSWVQQFGHRGILALTERAQALVAELSTRSKVKMRRALRPSMRRNATSPLAADESPLSAADHKVAALHECVRCVHAYMKSRFGIADVLSDSRVAEALIRCTH